MRVFVTGATGFIGKAVVQELLTAGHEVVGLARNDAAREALAQAGAEAHPGDLSNVKSLAAGARSCDGVIHLAFDHEIMAQSWETAAEMDRQVVEAMTGAMAGTNKPFVLTSGTALLAYSLPPGHIGAETDAPASGLPRAASEQAALAAAARGVRTSVVRLSPSVHGAGDRHGFVPALIDAARRTGVAAYVGDGANRWPAVHRLDAARLFRLALEKAEPGTRLHGVAEEGVPVRAIAETIGAEFGIATRSITAEEAQLQLGWIAKFVTLDNPTSSEQTRNLLDWRPQGPDLLTDMRENGYFAGGD